MHLYVRLTNRILVQILVESQEMYSRKLGYAAYAIDIVQYGPPRQGKYDPIIFGVSNSACNDAIHFCLGLPVLAQLADYMPWATKTREFAQHSLDVNSALGSVARCVSPSFVFAKVVDLDCCIVERHHLIFSLGYGRIMAGS